MPAQFPLGRRGGRGWTARVLLPGVGCCWVVGVEDLQAHYTLFARYILYTLKLREAFIKLM